MTVTTLAYTGAVQSYTVPAGITSLTLECWGAAGGHPDGLFAQGGYAKGALVVAPGTVLSVYVGGKGGGATGSGNPAGWNGGGTGSGTGSGGGGGSDVRLGGTALTNRVIVAGGAGGGVAGSGFVGGTGGGTAGGAGGNSGGSGGTQTTGYAVGQGEVGFPGAAAGGGGGGGYFGGRTTDVLSGRGGGGGSGYTGTLLTPTMTNGARAGDGQVVITAVNTAPYAPTLNTPATNASVFASDANTFGWTPNDPDPGDYQTRADFQWKVGAGAWTTVLSAATTATQYVVAGATFTTGTTVEWQVSTFDAFGLQSPWSASSFVNVIAALVAPTITSPAAGSNQFSTPVTMTWTLAAGIVGDSYQTQRTQNADGTGILYYDSGTVVSSLNQASIPLDPVAGRTDYLRVRFSYRARWSPWASVAISNQYGPPQKPLLVLTPDPATASVSVSITNPAAGSGYAATMSNDITRTSPDGSVDRIAAGLIPGATYVDGFPGVGLNIYTVTAYAASGSTAISN